MTIDELILMLIVMLIAANSILQIEIHYRLFFGTKLQKIRHFFSTCIETEFWTF
jgi:hypothetical protein